MSKINVMQDHPCTFRYNFPVDRFDRPGGFYSLADLPIAGRKVLERQGKVTALDSKQELYEVVDDLGGWTLVVPMSDVELEEI